MNCWLLRPIVNLPDAEYSRLTIVDPFLKRLFRKDKGGILDVKLLTATGKVINVEVQVLRFAAIRKRILYYHSKLLWEQLRGGDAYGRIQQVICVVICNHLLPEEAGGGFPSGLPGGEAAWREEGRAGRYLRSFSLRDDVTGESFTDLIKVITIELPRVPEEADQSP
ncbi:MAG: Rpn family recombination-promoting nuclease/putative transposase, partial [Spirochaetaceae bacterium]|nr:Rpn family recombination-promoting nuclease/putative transposase [Spirochaetaceae bacterium]